MENPKHTLAHLEAVEIQAEEILRDRSEIVALDRRRNGNREAIRALHKQKSTSSAWFALGPMLVKLPVNKATELLEKDQVVTGSEINKIRSNLKVKVNKLRDLEFEDPVPGLMLNPLNRGEMEAVKQVLGGHAS